MWGGASPSGFDCSGLTMYVYAQLGIGLDHYTGSQCNAGPHVSISQLQPGDLVFFYAGHDHVGIYMGGGLFIHAPHTGDVVEISSLVRLLRRELLRRRPRHTGRISRPLSSVARERLRAPIHSNDRAVDRDVRSWGIGLRARSLRGMRPAGRSCEPSTEGVDTNV